LLGFLVAGITCLLELFVTGLLIEIVFLRVLSLIFFIDLSYSCFPFEISFFHCGPFDILGL